MPKHDWHFEEPLQRVGACCSDEHRWTVNSLLGNPLATSRLGRAEYFCLCCSALAVACRHCSGNGETVRGVCSVCGGAGMRAFAE